MPKCPSHSERAAGIIGQVHNARHYLAAAQRLPEISEDEISGLDAICAEVRRLEDELIAAHAGAAKIWARLVASGHWTSAELNAAEFPRAKAEGR